MKILFFILLLFFANDANATPLPKSHPIYVELRCPNYAWRDRDGASYYIWVADIFTKEKKMVYPQSSNNGCVKFEFYTYFPLYSVINTNRNTTIPFYIEPYDSLIIEIDPTGKPLMYRNTDGSEYKYAKMLSHDISNNKLYTSDDYYADRDGSTFLSFTDILNRKMTLATDSVNKIANLYGFSTKERNLALSNTRMQYIMWLFEYTTFRSHMLQEYATKHNAGWQNSYEQDREIEHIVTPEYYTNLLSSTMNDSISLASQYLDVFISGYERSDILKHDLYMYSGDTKADSLRMDSVRFSRDMAISGLTSPSPLINLIVERQYVEIPDDYGLILKEAKIVAKREPKKEDNIWNHLSERDKQDIMSFTVPKGFNIYPLIVAGVKGIAKLIKGNKTPKLSKREQILKSFEDDDDISQKIRTGVK